MSKTTLRLATRSSPLAMVQANTIKQQLQVSHPNLTINLIPITTQGDQNQQTSLQDIGGKSLFVKALQEALLKDEADFAVHCVKDMSVLPCDGLVLTAVGQRAPANDVLVSAEYASLEALPSNAVIGTASPRRHCQIKAFRPYCDVKLCRGNINTRLNRLLSGEYDAIILAHAGLIRLDIKEPNIVPLPLESFIPAIGQGALGIECRENDLRTQALLSHLDHPDTRLCIQAEREINVLLQGDCHTPIGAHATLDDGKLNLSAMIGDLESDTLLRANIKGPCDQATQLARDLANQLIDQGALKLINQHQQKNKKG